MTKATIYRTLFGMDTAIDAIRGFNRFFTQHVGAIDAHFLGTDLNLAEARLLFEIARHQPVLATTLQDILGIDAGYCSRIVGRFERKGWIQRDRASEDGRRRPIRLTDAGQRLFAEIDARQRAAVAHDLAELDPVEQEDLRRALTRARLLLDRGYDAPLVIRPFRAGEANAVVERQARLYQASHGWGLGLEAVEAATVARFLEHFQPDREQCWIADLDGVMAGAVFLTDEGENVARLRLLHVEPFARRRGIGDALVGGCIAFARAHGYRELTLWTQAVLVAARRLYTRHGFICTGAEEHFHFGVPTLGERWRKPLDA